MVRKAKNADYIFWLEKAVWDPIEASILLSGYEPEAFPDGSIPDNELFEATDGIHRLIIDSINNNDISVSDTPSNWLSWAVKKGLKADLIDYAIEKVSYKPNYADKSNRHVSTKERETFLIIIAALAKEAKLDISKTSKTSELIANMTSLIGVPISATTIENKLKEIPQALENRVK